LNKAIGQWNKGIRADIDFLGHWHQFKDFGNAIVNGSMIGFNASLCQLKPTTKSLRQAFCLIEKDWGKTLVQPDLP
jgi:hypothetical protein